MSRTQVRNMLDQVHEFRGQLDEYYSRLSDTAAQQRVRMLLDYMASHERNLQKSMARFEEAVSWQVMDAYVDCKYCDEILATCRRTPIAPETSLAGVVKVAMDVDRCLLRFYREVAENAESEVVREVFRNLMDAEEAEIRNLALNALGAQDI